MSGARMSHLVPSLRVIVDATPPVLRIELWGELDIATVGSLDRPDVLAAGDAWVHAVVIDLAELRFCDVAGLRALMRLRDHHVACQRVTRLENPSPHLARLVVMTRLDDTTPR